MKDFKSNFYLLNLMTQIETLSFEELVSNVEEPLEPLTEEQRKGRAESNEPSSLQNMTQDKLIDMAEHNMELDGRSIEESIFEMVMTYPKDLVLPLLSRLKDRYFQQFFSLELGVFCQKLEKIRIPQKIQIIPDSNFIFVPPLTSI